jgi:hypothetical protein
MGIVSSSASTWTCYNCGARSDGVETKCSRCQHPRYRQRPAEGGAAAPETPLFESPGFLKLVIWSALALAGLVLCLFPSARGALGIHPLFAVAQLLASGSATLAALWELTWSRRLERVDVALPDAVEACEEFLATVHVVPCRDLEGVSVRVSLIERYFVTGENGRWEARSSCLASHEVGSRLRLRAGRPHSFSVQLKAPFPSLRHENLQAQLAAGALGCVGWIVPGVSSLARRLRDHGGHSVCVDIGVGLLSRRFEKPLVTYSKDGIVVPAG